MTNYMLHSLLIGIGGVIGLVLLWALVQLLWRNTFSAYMSTEDAMGDRTKCSNCGCTTACEKKSGEWRVESGE